MLSNMKILGIDIETSPNTGYFWALFKQNIQLNHLIDTSRVMCFSAMWFGTSSPLEDYIQFESEYPRRHDVMIRRAWKLLNDADVIVHFNGTSFDLPKLNVEFIKVGMPPPSPYQQVDLLKVARQQFRFTSNKMDHLLDVLGLGHKVRHSGFTMWKDCMERPTKETWAMMQKYNMGDIVGLELLYYRMLPWIKMHPNHALFQEDGENPIVPLCPNCGSEDVHKDGFAYTKTQKYQRYECRGCHTWPRARVSESAKDPANRLNILTQA